MPEWFQSPLVGTFFDVVGICGMLIFGGRFYLQWWVSERNKKSVVPIGFWYMSAIGSLLLLSYATYGRSPIGALSHTFNIVIYARNLIHIWRERGALSRRRNRLVHAAMGLVVLVAVGLLIHTWTREAAAIGETDLETARQTWLWLFIGAVGQGLFGCRFFLQWFATEKAKKSVVPPIFWYLSLVAAALLTLSFVQRGEWIFVAATGCTVPIYARNIWFVRREKAEAEEAAA